MQRSERERDKCGEFIKPKRERIPQFSKCWGQTVTVHLDSGEAIETILTESQERPTQIG